MLGDFGAATIYGKGSEIAGMLERMEVFAYGHLIEDLLGLVERRVDGDSVLGEKDAYVIEGLNLLHWRCTDPVVGQRPAFAEVYEELDGL